MFWLLSKERKRPGRESDGASHGKLFFVFHFLFYFYYMGAGQGGGETIGRKGDKLLYPQERLRLRISKNTAGQICFEDHGALGTVREDQKHCR